MNAAGANGGDVAAPFMVSRSIQKSPVVPMLLHNLGNGTVSGPINLNSALDAVEVGCIAVRDARIHSVYAYCCVFRFSELGQRQQPQQQQQQPSAAAPRDQVAALNPNGPVAVDPKKRLLASLRALKYLGSSRMCVAWHAPDEQLDEALLTVVNECCIGEQTPLMCAASAREAAAIVQALSRPTGVRNARQSAFGRAASSVNAKMAALLLHTMGTKMLNEAEAVRVVDAYARSRPGATPADLIAFLGSSGGRKEAVLFLSREAQVTKAAAERLADVFGALFDPKRPPHADRAQLMGDAADGAPILTGPGGNRPRDGDEIQRGSNGPAAPVDDLSTLLERFASRLEQRDAVAVAPQQQRQEQAAMAVAAAFQPPTLMGTALQQMRALPPPAGSNNLLAQLKAAELRKSERESEQSRQRLAATLAGALAAQFDRDDDDDDDEFA